MGLSHELALDRVDCLHRRDEDLLQRQAPVYDDETKLIQSTRDALVDLQQLFEAAPEPGAGCEHEVGSLQSGPD